MAAAGMPMTDTNTKPARVEISKRLVLINSASSLVTRMLSISVLIWLQQYLLKRITPEEYSLLPVLYSVMMFAPLVTTILTGGLGRYIVEAYAKHDDERVTQIVSTMFPILCATGLLFLAGGWTFAWYIDKILNIAPERLWDARIMMALLMFSAAISLPLSPFTCGFFVRQKFVLQNIIGVGTEIFRLSILFTLLFGVSTRVLWVVTASVCAGFLGQVINVIISRRLVPTLRFRPSHIHWPIAKALTSFGGWQFCAQLSSTIVMGADTILLNAFGTPVDVTCFHIGSLPFKHIEGTVGAATGSLGPAIIALHATGKAETLRKLYQRVGKFGLLVSMFVALPLIIYSKQLVLLYIGSEYQAAAIVMALMLLYFPLAYGSLLAPLLLRAIGNIRAWALACICIHAFNFLITIYLVVFMKLGAVGCALGSLASFIAGYPFFIWALGLRAADISSKAFLKNSLFPGLLPSLITACVWFYLRQMYEVETWFELGTHFVCGWTGYGVLCLFILDDDDRADIGKFMAHLRKVF
jgi:O-antigen/teichoic acid export membrane protein